MKRIIAVILLIITEILFICLSPNWMINIFIFFFYLWVEVKILKYK